VVMRVMLVRGEGYLEDNSYENQDNYHEWRALHQVFHHFGGSCQLEKSRHSSSSFPERLLLSWSYRKRDLRWCLSWSVNWHKTKVVCPSLTKFHARKDAKTGESSTSTTGCDKVQEWKIFTDDFSRWKRNCSSFFQ
jgi:hypothetical protein